MRFRTVKFFASTPDSRFKLQRSRALRRQARKPVLLKYTAYRVKMLTCAQTILITERNFATRVEHQGKLSLKICAETEKF